MSKGPALGSLNTFEFWTRDRRPVVAGPPGHTGARVAVKRTYAPGRPSRHPSKDVLSRHRAVWVLLGKARRVGAVAVYEYDRVAAEVDKSAAAKRQRRRA